MLSTIVGSVTANSPDLLLVDSEFPDIDLDDTIREVKQVGGEIAVAVIAGSEEWSLLDSSMRAGATSFYIDEDGPGTAGAVATFSGRRTCTRVHPSSCLSFRPLQE